MANRLSDELATTQAALQEAKMQSEKGQQVLQDLQDQLDNHQSELHGVKTLGEQSARELVLVLAERDKLSIILSTSKDQLNAVASELTAKTIEVQNLRETKKTLQQCLDEVSFFKSIFDPVIL